MPVDKYIQHNGTGGLAEKSFIQVSAGAASDGRAVAAGSDGKLDVSFLPTGVGPDTETIPSSEALAAGDFVNIWNSTGQKVRKADASTTGKEADGFVLAAFASGANALVYMRGTNNQVTGQTVGAVFLSTTAPGKSQAAAPTAAGHIVQRLGKAISATAIVFGPSDPITLA